MSRPTVNILVNLSANDVPCTNPAGDSNFLLLGSGDYLVWKDSQQMVGDTISGMSYPVIIPESVVSEAPKLFLADYSEAIYQQVVLAGTSLSVMGGDNRYVCCAWFSGATATIPYLEMYDDDTHETWESKPLGDGVPADSLFKAICTTNAVPGSATWSGTPLAGTDSRIALDTGALSGAKYLYWNMKQILTSVMSDWSSADWYSNDLVFSIHFTYS
jgi:hypothetical protein